MMLGATEVLFHYNLGSGPISVSKIEVGLINETHRVRAPEGDFILQKLHSIYGLGTVINVAGVAEFLTAQGWFAPQVLRTKEGAWGVEDSGQWWRMSTYIPGRVWERVDAPLWAYEAGKILGRFHGAMRNYSGILREARRVHDSASHWNELLKVVPPKQEPEIEELMRAISALPSLFLPDSLERVIAHGDPKISNIIFEEADDCAKALIDLDGCNKQNSVVIEWGDAFRSWCGGDEDDYPNSFDLDKFQAGWVGYLEGAKMVVTRTERALLPRGIKLIILELASRFLRDFFEDRYFGWNSRLYPSRKAHNLARAKGQVALYLDFAQKESEIVKIVNRD